MSASEDEVEGMEEEEVAEPPMDFFDHEPSKQEKLEMRKASKTPSDWLKLLCKDWADENEHIVDNIDARFLEYKPFLKGMLSSQLLCRLSQPSSKDGGIEGDGSPQSVDIWRIIEDDFDKAFIFSQIERFCLLYNIRGQFLDDSDSLLGADYASTDPASLAAAAAADVSVSPGSYVPLNAFMNDSAATATAAAAAAAATTHSDVSKLSKKQVSAVSQAHRVARDAEKALENERRMNVKREQRRATQEKKEQKAREREAQAVQKALERAAKEANREERRIKKVEIREQREKFAQEQKEAALRRAAELVSSNRVPIEITRGTQAVRAASAALLDSGLPDDVNPPKKRRSAIVVSTAADLHRIVTHSKNLFAKYNAIAKEHNQKVNWITVARELGIHVKVREKYARMHSRAEQRGLDWVKNGSWKIKDHPEIFLEPTQAEQKAKMPPPHPSEYVTVGFDDNNKELSDEAVAAAESVVDATVTSPAVEEVIKTTDEHNAAAAAVAATLVADPTAGLKVDEV